MTEAERVKRWSLPVLNEDNRGWEAKIGTAIFRIQNRLERCISEVIEVHGLTMPQFDVLMTLRAGEGINQQELAERLLVTKGNVVGIIDRVSAAGLLERRPDPTDRRSNRLYLTDAGRRLVNLLSPSELTFWKAILSKFTEGETRMLYELLIKLEAAVQESP